MLSGLSQNRLDASDLEYVNGSSVSFALILCVLPSNEETHGVGAHRPTALGTAC